MYCKRPWLQEGDTFKGENGRPQWVSKEIKDARTKAMNIDLVANWNTVVSPLDTVKHIGDFCFYAKNSDMDAAYWEKRLNGKIVHFKGNHDRSRQIKGMLEAAVEKMGGHEVLMKHRPPERIEEIPDFCDVVLCGHVHEMWHHIWIEHVLVLNMSVEMWDYKPVPVDVVIGEINRLQKIGPPEDSSGLQAQESNG